MFVSKRKVRKKEYFYLEDRVKGKRIAVFLGLREKAVKGIDSGLKELIQRKAIESFRESKKKFRANELNESELLALEELKINFALMKEFFPESFKSFKEDEFIRYAQGSASVEGNSLSLQEAALVLNKGIAVTGKKIDEIREIENMKLAAEVSLKIKKLNEKTVKKIHSAIMHGFEEKKPGEYRKGPMFITASRVKPPAGEKVPDEMNKLFEWLEKNKEIHSIELAAEFHARFEEIHPFTDGNGRTGREILNFMLQKAGYPRAIINSENRQSYILLLERIQTAKKFSEFTKFIYYCMEKKAKEISKIIEENKTTITKKLKEKIK